jgi:hypothetical protein
MDWDIGDIIRETIHLKQMEDNPIINTFLILDVLNPDCFLIHSMDHGITYKLMPLDSGVLYEKVG